MGADDRVSSKIQTWAGFEFRYVANNTAGPSERDLPVLLIDFDSRDTALSISSSPEALCRLITISPKAEVLS